MALLHSKSSFLFCFAAAKLCFFHFCPPTFRKLMFHFEYAKGAVALTGIVRAQPPFLSWSAYEMRRNFYSVFFV